MSAIGQTLTNLGRLTELIATIVGQLRAVVRLTEAGSLEHFLFKYNLVQSTGPLSGLYVTDCPQELSQFNINL